MDIMCKAIETSFKIFWDGAISNYMDTNKSSENNKVFLNKLLEMRANTEQEVDPPVVLIHGNHTESCLRSTLTKIKAD